ncbi:copper-binding protein [Tolumonas lignilytica]|jgi:Uncharacterized conserved protein|uniref:copper-binding protein n=1 Tax=Tolumonas lignilytica TaxID=1283284 RepID=UPI000464BAD8|nr:copper-binding protein [Tolumonas lignilytica]
MKGFASGLIVSSALLLFMSVAQADIETYQTHGMVKGIDAANNRITLSQDAVSELGWPQRTMTYNVDGKNILDGVKVGQSVDVSFSADSPYNASVHFVTPTK